MTALLSKHFSGCHMATEEENDQNTPWKEIWREKKLDIRIQVKSWRNIEATAQNRAGWRRVICGLCFAGS